MRDEMEFGECLKKLLFALNISGSKLAKALNVDPSLVSKWVNCKKVPSYRSPYVEDIADYIEKSIVNSFQKQKIDQAIDGIAKIENFQNESIKIKDKIKFVLLQAQGYSIENKLHEKSLIKNTAITSLADRLKSKMPVWDGIEKELYEHLSFENKRTISPIPLSQDNYLVSGYREVLYTALSLLEEAARTSPSSKEPILMTYNTTMNLMPFFPEFYLEWKKAIIKALSNGWNIIVLVRFNNNLDRTLKFIDEMQSYLMAGKYMPYYTSKYDFYMPGRELMVIPHIGAMEFLSTKLNNQPDSAFYFRDEAVIHILMKNLNQMISYASPLINKYSLCENARYLEIISEFDEIPSNRYLWKDGISSLSISLELYEKYLKMSRRSREEIDKLTEYHRRRLEAFSILVKGYKYQNIFTKESIEDMVRRGEYSFNEYYLIGKYKATPWDIKRNLENVIHLLKKHDNYEVALVDKKKINNESSPQWVVKEQKEVLFHMKDKNNSLTLSNDSDHGFDNVIIKEPMVVRAFEEKFLNNWNHIIPQNKDKREVILWLDSQIKILSKIHNI